MPTISAIKTLVTRVFKQKHYLVRKMNGTAISRDDSLELLLATRALRLMRRPELRNTRGSGKSKVFVISASPSKDWHSVSYLVDTSGNADIAVRTGLQVSAQDSQFCEVDVGFYQLTRLREELQLFEFVSHESLRAMAECKLWKSALSLPTANETIGKIYRLGGGPKKQSPKFSLVCLRTSSAAPINALRFVRCEVFDIDLAPETWSSLGMSEIDQWVKLALT